MVKVGVEDAVGVFVGVKLGVGVGVRRRLPIHPGMLQLKNKKLSKLKPRGNK